MEGYMIGKYAAIAAIGALCIAGPASAKDAAVATAKAPAAKVATTKVSTCVAEAKAKGTAVQASCLNTGLVPATQGNAAQSFMGLSGLQLAGLLVTVAVIGVGIANVLDSEEDPVSP